jgi:hypothetical protein
MHERRSCFEQLRGSVSAFFRGQGNSRLGCLPHDFPNEFC